jgi:hypothetical protein
MKTSLSVLASTLALCTGLAHAADPVPSGLPAGVSFQEYSGAAAVGNGHVDTRNVLWYIDEQTVGGLKSWYILFDPAGGQSTSATITFDRPIVDVLDTKAGLDGTNGTYGIDVDGDGVLDDYDTSFFIAPELQALDTVSWLAGGNTVTIHWNAVDPGDHIRVLVQVPEPSTYALFGIGGLVLALATRRRRRG